MLRLSQGELRLPYWRANAENSSLSLELLWRSPAGNAQGRFGADWLDGAKLRSLGFDVGVSGDGKKLSRPVFRQLSKPVLLVLELDGPACRQALDAAQAHLAEVKAIGAG